MWDSVRSPALIGFNYGARQYHRVKETFKSYSSRYLHCPNRLSVINIWPAQIVGLFSKGDTALTELTSGAMLTFFAMFPVVGFQIIGSNYFQAVGKPVQSTILSLSRQALLFIPLLLILPHFWGIDGVWRTAPIADGLAVILTATLVFLEMKNLPKSQPLDESLEQHGKTVASSTK